jgi:nucleoside-diphosphate-sugar epimerase
MTMKESDLVLLTGANGWLGRRLVRALTVGHPEMGPFGAGGRRVRMLVRPGEKVDDLLALGTEKVDGDLRDPAAARSLAVGAAGGTLIHLAGIIHPSRGMREFTEVNVEGTKTVITEAGKAGVRRTIVMSSNSPIGVSRNPFEVFDEESAYNPYMGYGRSKQAMEEWLRAGATGKILPEITIVRAPWFYGPEQPARQTRFFSMIKAGRFPIVGNGHNRRSMGYVDSLAYGILLAANAPHAAGKIYWLADERPYPMKEIIDTVRDVLRDDFGMSVNPKTVQVPGIISDVARLADWMLQKAGIYNPEIHVLSEMNLTIACSIERAQRELGYKPLVNLREGMRRSVAWCLERGISI